MRSLLFVSLIATTSIMTGCGESSSSGTRVAYVTNGVASFWTIAAAGARAAGKDLNVDVEIRMPKDVTDQKRIVEDLVNKGVDGIAISPIDGAMQVELINEAAAQTKLITQDADAPSSNRLCYIGMDNYEAGRACGRLVKEALPEGGSVVFFIGRINQVNGKLRRQGVIDELMDWERDPERFTPAGEEPKTGKYQILDTRLDELDPARAKANAQDAINKYPDLDCMVGFFADNPPACLEALRQADKLGEIQVVGFDEAPGTLQGIVDGHVHGTVTQQPYVYGYKSVEMLTKLIRGEENVIPESQYVDVPVTIVRKDNVEEFRKRLEELLAQGESK
ncbi:MAG: sugar-binding protein [Planctomycetota bacterium]